MVISLHLVVEDFALSSGAGGDEMLVQDVQDVLADVFEFFLHLHTKIRYKLRRLKPSVAGLDRHHFAGSNSSKTRKYMYI